MTDDIVKRLRKPEIAYEWETHEVNARDAADEIERLREENRWLRNMVEFVVDDYGVPVSAFGRVTSRMADKEGAKHESENR